MPVFKGQYGQYNQAGNDPHRSVVRIFQLPNSHSTCMKGHCQMRRLGWRKEILVEHPAAAGSRHSFKTSSCSNDLWKILKCHRQLPKTACRKWSASYPCKRLQHHLQKTSRATRLSSSTFAFERGIGLPCDLHQSTQEHYSLPKIFSPHLIFKFIHFLSTRISFLQHFQPLIHHLLATLLAIPARPTATPPPGPPKHDSGPCQTPPAPWKKTSFWKKGSEQTNFREEMLDLNAKLEFWPVWWEEFWQHQWQTSPLCFTDECKDLSSWLKKCLLKGSKNERTIQDCWWNKSILQLLERILNPKTWRMIASSGSSKYFKTRI